jgi:hypothetical protein
VRADRIENPEEYFHRGGFVQLEPPVHLPSSSAQADQVEVWLALPEDGLIRTLRSAASDSGYTLEFPAGTRIDRVEWVGLGEDRKIVDVRGATVQTDGSQRYHVYRRTRAQSGAPLMGFAWPSEDPAVHSAATDALVDAVVNTPEVARMRPAAIKAVGDDLRSKNACQSCHRKQQPVALDQRERLVLRGTDASGFYVPQTVLADEAPLESYGAHDRNLTDPFVSVRCATTEVTNLGHQGRASCSDGAVPRARLDLAAAMAADVPRASRICRARLHLYQQLDPLGQQVFAEAARACAATPPTRTSSWGLVPKQLLTPEKEPT